jgi:hypothetical protein
MTITLSSFSALIIKKPGPCHRGNVRHLAKDILLQPSYIFSLNVKSIQSMGQCTLRINRVVNFMKKTKHNIARCVCNNEINARMYSES